MTRTEFYSWSIFASIGGLSWLAFGFPGVICLIVGAIVGNIDVAWVEDHGRLLSTSRRAAPAAAHADARTPDRKLSWRKSDDLPPLVKRHGWHRGRLGTRGRNNIIQFPKRAS